MPVLYFMAYERHKGRIPSGPQLEGADLGAPLGARLGAILPEQLALAELSIEQGLTVCESVER